MQIEHSEFQDALVRGLTHRMNNILTLFHGYLGLLMDNKKLDAEAREGLAKIKEGARAASELMDRTHSLVRPTAVVWREVNVGEFLRMLKPTFDAMRSPDTTLTLEIPDGLPRVWADAGRVKTAIVEIVRNALDATAEGGHVTIQLHAESGPDDHSAAQPLQWLFVRVIDDGPGLPVEIGERVFQPFYSTKKRQHSTGLGLTVALGFAQQHGGVIRFESAPGRTVFDLVLPSRAE